jgi:hypothetical protein
LLTNRSESLISGFTSAEKAFPVKLAGPAASQLESRNLVKQFRVVGYPGCGFVCGRLVFVAKCRVAERLECFG